MAHDVQLPVERYQVNAEFQVNALSGDHAERFVQSLFATRPEDLLSLLYAIRAQRIDLAIPGYTLEHAERALTKVSQPAEETERIELAFTPDGLQKYTALVYIQLEQLKADKAGDMEEEITLLMTLLERLVPKLPPSEL